MCILIIDDNPAIRDSLRRTLEYDGEVIVGAASGREGLALVERDTPDLVLLDVEMPGMSGLDVLKRLHTTHQSLPVVMMSAHVTQAIVVEAIRTGAAGFLEKPFENADRLLTTIHCAIEQARLRNKTPGHECTAGIVATDIESSAGTRPPPITGSLLGRPRHACLGSSER